MPEHKNFSDAALIRLYIDQNDAVILGEIYSRYLPLVYGVCLKYLKDREESKDAAMHLFEKLPALLRQHEVTHFKSWLYVTARNTCLMQLRARKGKNFEEISDRLMESEAFLHLEDDIKKEDDLIRLERCIETLALEQRHCVKLFFLEQKCYRDIIVSTGFDNNKVKSYIQNGKRNLKICMEQND